MIWRKTCCTEGKETGLAQNHVQFHVRYTISGLKSPRFANNDAHFYVLWKY